jgi:hypothetical protein
MRFTSLTTTYPEPDFSVIAQSTKDISRLAFFQTDTMKAVTEKASRVSSYALDLQTIVGEQLVNLSTEVKGLDFQDLFGQLSQIDAELAKGTLSAADKQEVLLARGELETVFSGRVDGLRQKLGTATAAVQGKSDEISAVVLAERVEEALKRATDRKPELVTAIQEKRDAWQGFVDDRKKIIEAQDVIRARNIADIIKDFIPKDLEKLDLKKPEAEAIRLGVEVLKKILGEISEGFKYSDLADQRKALDGKISALDVDIKGLEADQIANDALLGDLTAVMNIHSKRAVLLDEVKKLPVAFTGFADTLGRLSGSQVTEATVISVMQTIKTFVGNCLDARNKVIIT